jgi:UDP-N-acetylglucosamine 1-carboxyvinyltransferase
MQELLVQGGKPLNGTVKIGGSKNAVLPILAATLLADSICTLDNVPDISDVHSFLQILEGLGSKTSFENGRVTVDPTQIQVGTVEPHLVKHMRASILLLGPLLGRFKEVILAYPGGCVLGKRSVHAHLHALTAFGAEVVESSEAIHLRAKELTAASIIMAEASVTATENAIMTAVCVPGRTEIRWAAMEPHVQDLCEFLVKMGADIQGLGTHTLIIEGGKPLHGAQGTPLSRIISRPGPLFWLACLRVANSLLKTVLLHIWTAFSKNWKKWVRASLARKTRSTSPRMMAYMLWPNCKPPFTLVLQRISKLLLPFCSPSVKVKVASTKLFLKAA